MRKNILHLLFIIPLGACSHWNAKQQPVVGSDDGVIESVSVHRSVGDQRVDPVLKKVIIPDCQGCVVGSSSQKTLLLGERKAYYLHGAEHLALKNNYFDIPVVYNEATIKWINYFVTRGKKFFVRYSERAGRYAPILSKMLHEEGLPRDLIYLAMAESGFQNKAKSWAKAVGPWQFMSFTGRKYGLNIDKWYIDERRDPIKATKAAAAYLKDLYELFGSWELAIAGYNAGEGKISRAIKRYGTKNFWDIRKGRYLKAETKNYVPKIMALAIIGKNLQAFGFEDINFQEPLNFEQIEVPPMTDLYKIANILGMEVEEIKKYNPELLRWLTPPREGYQLRVPLGRKVAWSVYADKQFVVANLDSDFQQYRMRGNASLNAVAKKFHLPIGILVELNNHPQSKKMRPGTKVYLPFRQGHSRRHAMYADLYEKPPRWIQRRNRYRRRLRMALSRGELVKNPKEFYIVKKGDTLWDVSKKTGVSMDTIIRSNYGLVKKRMIMPGDRLVIR